MDLDARLGVGARLELTRNRLINSVVLEADGGLLEVNDFQRSFWSGSQDENGWMSILPKVRPGADGQLAAQIQPFHIMAVFDPY